MKIHLSVALLVSVTNLSVCLNSIPWKSEAQEKPHYLPDWAVPPLCEKLKEVHIGDDSFLVLVSIQGANTKPKIFRKGCFLLQSKKFDGPPNGMIDPTSRYFTPRTYVSIYNNRKMRCHPFIEEKMPATFNPFNETVVTALEAIQICKFFGQSLQTNGERRFVPKYMPLVLNVDSKLRCTQWALDYQEPDSWVKQINRDCTQPPSALKKPNVVKAMSEATCQFQGGDVICKPNDMLQTRITRLNLLFTSHKREIKEKKASSQINKRNSKATLSSSTENEVIDKYVERVALKNRKNKVQKVQESNQQSEQQQSEQQSDPLLNEYEFRCENCKRVKKKSRRNNGNFKISLDPNPKFKSKSGRGMFTSNKVVSPPVLTMPITIPTITIPKQEKKEVPKSNKPNVSARNPNIKINLNFKNEAKVMNRMAREK